MLRFDIITLFPRTFASPLQESIIKKAQDRGLLHIIIHDLRDYAVDRHRTADDGPYGGGAGMVMKIEPIVKALEAIKAPGVRARTILTTPQGPVFSQEAAQRLSSYEQIVMVCGRYEGVDERVLSFVDEEVSIGDYIVTGGELPALVVLDAVARLVPGVVGDRASVLEDTFANDLLKYPQYTRPTCFRGLDVPEVLLSGNHERIRVWRKGQSLRKTLQRRPDLLQRAALDDEGKRMLKSIVKSDDAERNHGCN